MFLKYQCFCFNPTIESITKGPKDTRASLSTTRGIKVASMQATLRRRLRSNEARWSGGVAEQATQRPRRRGRWRALGPNITRIFKRMGIYYNVETREYVIFKKSSLCLYQILKWSDSFNRYIV